jgi:hypothetical protein
MSKDPTNADELEGFVSATLRAIMAGVEDAQAAGGGKSAFGTGTFNFRPPSDVRFDVAVTAKHTGNASGGMKIQVFSIGANAGGDVSSESSTVSRIQFSVPTTYKSGRGND